MNIILLSGGSGKRLWPLSNEIRSKQFIKIFDKPEGKRESMLQRTYNSIKRIDNEAKITIATSNTQVSELINQLGDGLNLSVEPVRKDTFPAIALACAYLHDVMKVDDGEAVVVCPVDPYVEDSYFEALKKLYALAKEGDKNITMLGVEPTYPSEKYGYIIPKEKADISEVIDFKEKPYKAKAKEYISKDALWNGGAYAFKLGYMLNKAHERIGFYDYYDLFGKFETLKKEKIEKAVIESEKSAQVLRFSGKWEDVGTWNTLFDSINYETLGKVKLSDDCENVKAVNVLGVPLLCVGMKDAIIAASAEGILVTSVERASSISPLIDEIGTEIRFSEETWGKRKVINDSNDSLTSKLTIRAGSQLPYSSHNDIDKTWTIISGEGTVVIKGESRHIQSGDVITIKAGSGYTLIADTDVKLIEVQIRRNASSSDEPLF